MTTRDELLRRLWKHINSYTTPYYVGRVLVREDDLDQVMARGKQLPNEPFADAGPAIERILAAGADRRDLRLVLRWAAYGAVFDTLYEIEGLGSGDLDGIHELLLNADPSGMEGRPGSADAAATMAAPK